MEFISLPSVLPKEKTLGGVRNKKWSSFVGQREVRLVKHIFPLPFK